MSSPSLSKRSTSALGALAGIASAILALGVAELTAGLRQEWRSRVIDVGDRVIDNVPPFVKDFAIETFGTHDKPALLIGIGVSLLVCAAVVGANAATSNRVGGSIDDAFPTIVGAAAGAAALWFAHRIAVPLLAGSSDADPATPSDPTDAKQPSPTNASQVTRRDLPVRSGGVLAALAFVGTGPGFRVPTVIRSSPACEPGS